MTVDNAVAPAKISNQMNMLQRIVLIVGAIVILIVLVNTESYRYWFSNLEWSLMWDWRAALVRCGVLAMVTAAIYFAVGKRKS